MIHKERVSCVSIEIILILNKEKNEKAKINSFSHCCDGYVYRLWKQDKKIPSALTMDAAIEHSFKNDQWVLTFKVKNLMDRHVVSEFNRPLPGRYIGVKVRYLLK